MELRHLRYFTAIADEGSFTRAAAKVGIGQPPLSQQIKDLEDELGTRLFRRLPHGVELTEAGEAFREEAEAILTRAAAAVKIARRAARGERGSLRLGYAGSALFHPRLPAALKEFREAFPGVELALREAPTAALIESVESGELDGAFLRPGRMDPPGMRVLQIDDEAMLAAVPAGHRLAKDRRRQVELKDLGEEEWLLFPRAAGQGWFDEIVATCRAAGFEPRLRQEAPQITSVANLVAAGLGAALLPECLTRAKTPGVVYLRLAGEPLKARLVFAMTQKKRGVPVERFEELLTASLIRR